MDAFLEVLLGDLIVSLIGIGPLPPPMTQEEVRAQQLWPTDCLTTRSGIEMSCQQAFLSDLDRGEKRGDDNRD